MGIFTKIKQGLAKTRGVFSGVATLSRPRSRKSVATPEKTPRVLASPCFILVKIPIKDLGPQFASQRSLRPTVDLTLRVRPPHAEREVYSPLPPRSLYTRR